MSIESDRSRSACCKLGGFAFSAATTGCGEPGGVTFRSNAIGRGEPGGVAFKSSTIGRGEPGGVAFKSSAIGRGEPGGVAFRSSAIGRGEPGGVAFKSSAIGCGEPGGVAFKSKPIGRGIAFRSSCRSLSPRGASDDGPGSKPLAMGRGDNGPELSPGPDKRGRASLCEEASDSRLSARGLFMPTLSDGIMTVLISCPPPAAATAASGRSPTGRRWTGRGSRGCAVASAWSRRPARRCRACIRPSAPRARSRRTWP